MIPETKHRLYVDVQAVFLLCPRDGTWHTYLSQTQGFGSSNLPADTPQAIFKWMRGDSVPTIDNMIIIADMFGVTIDQIVVIKRI